MAVVPPTRQLSQAHYSTLEQDLEPRLTSGLVVANGELEIVTEIGRGATAVVYRAIDRGSGREVALKVATAKASAGGTRRRLENEARIGGMLGDHPHVVSPLRVGTLDGPVGFVGRMYLVSELVEGRPLDILMSHHHRGLAPERAIRIARDIAGALAELHEQGIVHRDLKPANVLIAGKPPGRARVIDFALAYRVGDEWSEDRSGTTRDNHMVGTVLYMAPEQALGRRPASPMDIYAFGALAYELFSGNPPHYRVPTAELLARKCDPTRSPISLSRMCQEIDPSLALIIDRCLSYEPEVRPTATQLLDAFDEALCPPAAAGSALLTDEPQKRRRTRLIGGSMLLVMVLLASLALTVGIGTGPRPATEQTREPLMASMSPTGSGLGLDASPRSSVDARETTATSVLPEHPAAASEPDDEPRTREADEQASARTGKPRGRCSGAVGRAQKAALHRQWGKVLRMTRSADCWKGSLARERALLRTQAYFEKSQYARCVQAVGRWNDPELRRWRKLCQARSKAGEP